MSDNSVAAKFPLGRIEALAAAVILPAFLSFLFWRVTPTVGGWGAHEATAAQAAAPGPYQDDPNTLDGSKLYADYCAACHGADLEGGRIGPGLHRPDWPYAKSPDLLVNIIHQGRGLTMPGFEGKLSNAQVEALAGWLQERNREGK